MATQIFCKQNTAIVQIRFWSKIKCQNGEFRAPN
jgi:hypothetical protein